MPLPTFTPPIPPSPGTSKKPEFKMLSAEFGDGYTQEMPKGLNHIRDVVTFRWDMLTPAQAQAIEDFLLARRGSDPFYYQTTTSNRVQKWTCKDFERGVGDSGFQTFRATFKESFDLRV